MILQQTLPLNRCPHCQKADPTLAMLYPHQKTVRADGNTQEMWGVFRCFSCGSLVTTRCYESVISGRLTYLVRDIYPDARAAHEDIPPVARKFLQQAYETLHAPDAAAVMAGSAVDAMLKALNYADGSVYARVEKAVSDNVLTADMGKWAHSVRLGSNRPRHADAENPHVLPEEAKQSVEFAEALGQFLFVLKAQIDRGVRAAGGS